MPEELRATGPLRPIELATAAVLAGVAVALTVIGWFLPHLGPVAALSVVPLGVVAHRHRFRALAAATFAASVLSFLVAGTGTVSNVIECAIIGGLVGTGLRRNWGFGRVIAIVSLIAPVIAAVAVGLLAIFDSIRRLTLLQIHNTWKGVERILNNFHQFNGALHHADKFVAAALRDWWITVGILVVFATFWFAALAWVLLVPVLERLSSVRAVDRLDPLGATSRDQTPGPVPLEFRDASYRYEGSATDALAGITLTVGAGELVALVGDNGSGKSTLARLLAGMAPTSGTVHRVGDAALGQPGGTAMIMQHPETQILGVRVADDVVWGLRADFARGVDVPTLLEAVGLAGMDHRDTSTLSGGELQRLAVAAALARRPKLLVSDESTTMVDSDGRKQLVALLSSLPASHGMTVAHVTHRREETAGANRLFRLDRGRIVASSGRASVEAPKGQIDGPLWPQQGRPVGQGGLPPEPGGCSPVRAGRLELVGVTHTYAAGTPWAQPALLGIELSIEPQEGVLVVGGNGSGKSTLAWVLAGVLQPSEGDCLLGGRPVRGQIGAVGLAFQHARLQLQRQTVGQDLIAAGASTDLAAAEALERVGLDPKELAGRRVDELSGGQQRRVALAGILARRPSVIVLDEPLAGLDAPGQSSLMGVLASLRHQHGLTVVVISHDLEGMDRVCDRVVHLDAGRLVSNGSRSEPVEVRR